MVLFCFSARSNADSYIDHLISLNIKKVMRKIVKSPLIYSSKYERIRWLCDKNQAWMRFILIPHLVFCG